nr:hypothetical protein GCM10020063_040850 [Dactylosporangium thailandense]
MSQGSAMSAEEARDRAAAARAEYWSGAVAQAAARTAKEERDDTVMRPNDPGEAQEWRERQYAYGEEQRIRAFAANLRSGSRPHRRGAVPTVVPRRVPAPVRSRGKTL